MSFFENLKNNRDTQIMALSIVFFVLAFPIYFGLAAANADEGSGLNAVNMYEVAGEINYIEIAAGDEFIADGDTLTIDNLHTDSIDDADDLNIIGVRISMSYGEDEQQSGACPTGGPSADTITGVINHLEYNNSGSGNNDGGSGSHEVTIEWVNTSLIGEVVVMSKAEIIEQIDAQGEGLGPYSGEVSVEANAGPSTPFVCQRSDGGEEVSYVIELIVFDYDIRPFFEVVEEI
jgi:hypothetical protein